MKEVDMIVRGCSVDKLSSAKSVTTGFLKDEGGYCVVLIVQGLNDNDITVYKVADC